METLLTVSADMRAAYSHVPSPVLILDQECSAVLWQNRAAEGLLRLDAEGAGFTEKLGRADRRQIADAAARLDPEDSVTLSSLSGFSGFSADLRRARYEGAFCVILCLHIEPEQPMASAQLRTAETLLGLGWWEYDIEARSLSWSERVHELMGVPEAEAPPGYDGYLRLIHPADREATIEAYRKFVRGEEPSLQFKHRVVREDGHIFHIQGSGERQYRNGKDIVVGVVQDVTSLVKAAQRLNEVEGLLKLAGDHARFGAWYTDLEAGRLLWTEQVGRIFGLPDDHVPMPGDGMRFIAPEYQDELQAAYENCIATGADFQMNCEVINASGRRVWVTSSGRAIRDEAGRIVGVKGALQDISAIRDAEERAVQAGLERVRILESISDAFFALDRDWCFTYVNPQAEKLLLRASGHLIGRNIWAEFPEAIGSQFQIKYEEVVRTGQAASFQEYFEPLALWFDVTAYPMGEGLSVYFRNITSQRKRDEHLRLLDAAVARQNDMLLITEAASLDAASNGPRIVYVNDAFVRHTGFRKEDVIGKTPRILQGPATDRNELGRIRRALEAWEPVTAELVNYRQDGTPFDIEVDIVPLADGAGNVTHWVAVQRDVSERKRAEEARRLSDERFRLVSMATNDVIWDWDFSTRKIWWNDAVTTVLGYILDDSATGPEYWINRIHPEDRERVLREVRQVIAGSGNRWTHEYRFTRADGTVAIVFNQAFIIRDNSGGALRIIGSMRDLTERRSLEQKLREAQKLEAVGKLTGGVAHDFNNLLTIILGNAEELSQNLRGNNQLRQIAEMTASAAERGAELTSRLLAFARRQPLEPMVSDLNQLIRGMEALFRRTLSEDIDIEFVRCAGLWSTEVDRGQLEVALLNLMVNARDAMPLGGKLTIETANVRLDEDYASSHREVASGQYVMVSVTDNGGGMDSATISRAFEPFFTTKEAGRGSGLGLSMVFGFVKQSRGHIKIYSEVGEGTSVKLYFPRSHNVAISLSPTRETASILGGSEKVLLVEDDDLVREHLAKQLESLGYGVIQAASGPEAVGILRQSEDIDLLLSDVVMPGGMNGRQLAEVVRGFRPSLKVLFTSGYTENAIVHHGRLDPGVELLSKPYRRKELAAKVRKVLDRNTKPEDM